MGYHTEFLGRLKIDVSKDVDNLEHLDNVEKFIKDNQECQWMIVNDDFDNTEPMEFTLKHNDFEKFDDYVKWMKRLITFFNEWKWNANGTICWRGEDDFDAGIICVCNNTVHVYFNTFTN